MMKNVILSIFILITVLTCVRQDDELLVVPPPWPPVDTTGVYDLDTIPPVITLLGGDTVRIPVNDPDTLIEKYLKLFTAVDDRGGDVFAIEPVMNVDIFNVRSNPYTIVYSFMDSSGNVCKATRYVFVDPTHPPVDTTPPIISISDTAITIPKGSAFTLPEVVAYDPGHGVVPSEQIVCSGAVNTAVAGTYTIVCNVIDSAGNTSSITRNIVVADASTCTDCHTRPVIRLLGGDTIKIQNNINPADFLTSFIDPGYSAMDIRDGDITDKVIAGPITEISKIEWRITYTVTNRAGLVSFPVIRTLIRASPGIDVPIIDLIYADSIIQIYAGQRWREPGYSAANITDGDLTNLVIVDSSDLVAHLDTPGVYLVKYTVTGSNGMKASKTRTVIVYELPIGEPTPPVLTLLGRNPDTVLVYSAADYADPGATAIDNRDGDLTAQIIRTGRVNMDSIGKYTVTYSVTDKAANRRMATRIVWVVPDTIYKDLFSRYGVPGDALPTLFKIYTKIVIDGDGPDVAKINKMQITWDAGTSQVYDFIITLDNAAPYLVDLRLSSQTFASAGPTLILKNLNIPGFDGTYYVGTDGSTFFWVESGGKFAIIWKE